MTCFRERTKGKIGAFYEKERIEKREYHVFCNPKEIADMPDPKWVHVKCLGMARLTRNDGESVSRETHFHLLDKPVGAEKYAGLARGHRAIENSLHRVPDIHFREDSSTANADEAISNLTLLRKIAFNFTKPDPAMQKKTAKKKMIDYMTDISLFKKLIYEIIPANA